MRGVCIAQNGGVECTQFETPSDAPPGFAKLEVCLAGICATDLQLVAGYKGASSANRMILGHEFVAIIDSISHAKEDSEAPAAVAEGSLGVGDRVVAEINCTEPGQRCSGDWRQRAQDPRRTALGIFGADGCFATYVMVPIRNLHRVPDSVTDMDAVFTEPLAAACSVLDEVRIRLSDKVAILGAGRLGSLIVAVLSATQCDLDVLVRNVSRAAHLKEVAAGRDVRTLPVSEASESSYDIVVEASGSPGGLQRALEICRPRGTVVLKSTYAPGNAAQVGIDMSLIVVKELHIVGSRCGPFAVALRLLQKGLVRPGALMHRVFPLEQAREAFEEAASPGVLKVCLRPSAPPDP